MALVSQISSKIFKPSSITLTYIKQIAYPCTGSCLLPDNLVPSVIMDHAKLKSSNHRETTIIDARTIYNIKVCLPGDLLREITDKRTIQSQVFDIFVYGDTLLVPRYHEKSVLSYKMTFDPQLSSFQICDGVCGEKSDHAALTRNNHSMIASSAVAYKLNKLGHTKKQQIISQYYQIR